MQNKLTIQITILLLFTCFFSSQSFSQVSLNLQGNKSNSNYSVVSGFQFSNCSDFIVEDNIIYYLSKFGLSIKDISATNNYQILSETYLADGETDSFDKQFVKINNFLYIISSSGWFDVLEIDQNYKVINSFNYLLIYTNSSS